ncbi:hypothetical protein MCOR25_001608 [Pyricularia grisea]|nr:hypothetical protein MCOR25_001608 [Pyricularia grisea]
MDDDDKSKVHLVDKEGRAEPEVKGNGIVKMEEPQNSATDSAQRSRSPSSMPRDGETKAVDGNKISPRTASPDPKSTRKNPQQLPMRTSKLFGHLADVTEEASRGFAILSDCVYASKALGNSGQETLDCDCEEDWRDGINHACAEDSDCINRVTKIECVSGNCGDGCQNQRFQRKQYANVSVIKTENKGYGLRADTDLEPNDFVFEYIGEVIGEELFRSRLMKYDTQRLEHFYFMSLTRTEYVDATKKGNLGRFCNHSCNPNCYVDKWVVGDKLRMGIFALRAIKAGEELCFNYNVDRYGANPQRCYCGESNCSGILGGKTQTERTTKLPLAMIEALGIDDGDHWESSVKKPRKKKAGESEEEYVGSIQPRKLEDGEVGVVMSTLRSCKEKWVATKLLHRILAVDEERVLNSVVKFHGYEYLKTTLNTFKDDDEVVFQVLNILYKLPRVTRNKIDDSNIEPLIKELSNSQHEEIAAESKKLLEVWKTLQVGYRIPRAKADRSARDNAGSFFDDRRQQAREAASAPLPRAPSPVRNAPTGPRSSMPQRNPHYVPPRRKYPQQPPRDAPALPSGWRSAMDQRTGRQYYWDTANPDKKSWVRPTAEMAKANAALQAQKIQDIINQCAQPTPKPSSATHTPQPVGTPVAEPKRETWRSWPADKQRRLYENTIFPHIKYVADKYYKRLPKEDLKKFVKDVNKTLAASDYKHGRVKDPSKVEEKQQSKIRKYTRDFLDKAVKKHELRQAEKDSTNSKKLEDGPGEPSGSTLSGATEGSKISPPNADAGVQSTNDSAPRSVDSPDSSATDLKRKRGESHDVENVEGAAADLTPGYTPLAKRVKETDVEEPSPPPPPPTPPPLDELDDAVRMEEATEGRRLREHEDELRLENEEAHRLQQDAVEQKRLREHEEALERENQETLLALQTDQRGTEADGDKPMANNVNGAKMGTVMV